MLSLSPLEQQVIQVLKLHPEYHALFETGGEALVQKDFPNGTASGNPFYHLGLHISLHEQIGMDRPPGIRQLFQQYKTAFGDLHVAEHAMLEVLERALWEAQAANRMPDDAAYLAALQKRLRERQAG